MPLEAFDDDLQLLEDLSAVALHQVLMQRERTIRRSSSVWSCSSRYCTISPVGDVNRLAVMVSIHVSRGGQGRAPAELAQHRRDPLPALLVQ